MVNLPVMPSFAYSVCKAVHNTTTWLKSVDHAVTLARSHWGVLAHDILVLYPKQKQHERAVLTRPHQVVLHLHPAAPTTALEDKSVDGCPRALLLKQLGTLTKNLSETLYTCHPYARASLMYQVSYV